MTSKYKEQTITLEIKTSFQKNVIILLSHIITLIIISFCVIFVGVNKLYLIITIILTMASFLYFFRLHIKLNSKNSIIKLYKDLVNNWSIELNGSKKHKVEIIGTSFVSEFFIIVNVIDESKKHYTALFTKDSLSNDEYRKLKVFINTNKLSA